MTNQNNIEEFNGPFLDEFNRLISEGLTVEQATAAVNALRAIS